ncbi:MAG: hypothetical protein IH594_15825 [Bacteroidales bacterium]|nr:hypothetical protein [Bacteroidales bacterium]
MKAINLFLILLLLFSCQKETEDSGIYGIKGKVIYDNGQVAKSSLVYLDNDLKTTTDMDGRFFISDVNAGKYKLKASNSDSINGYSEVEINIELKGDDLSIESLLLPVPVKLLDPEKVTSNSISLAWNKCGADDFREYKIYIHHSSALDESTGTLLHISTDVNDTTLSVKEGDFSWAGSSLTPNTNYYFRIFVMNSFGRLSGSNILKVTTSLWDNAGGFTTNYKLELELSFASQGRLHGIAWDGDYFWMLYYEELGGFYDNNRVTLVQYDYQQGNTPVSIVFDDSNYFPEGITWDGSKPWISFGSCIKSVNLQNEGFEKTLCTGAATVDMAFNDGKMALLDIWNKVTLLNPVNGIIFKTFDTPFKVLGYSGEKGIAFRESEIWIINWRHNEICILDESGNHTGVARVDFLEDGLMSNYPRMPMCFMNDKLVIGYDSQVRIYSIEAID